MVQICTKFQENSVIWFKIRNRDEYKYHGDLISLLSSAKGQHRRWNEDNN
jgi:hypothetical protein